MQIITGTVTFTNGTAVVLSTVAAFGGIPRFAVAKVYIEPASGNTHVCYVGDWALTLGTSTVDHVIRQLAKPSAADAVLDSYTAQDEYGQDTIMLSDFSLDGTTNEKARVTVFVR